MRNVRRIAFAITFILMIAGCTSVPPHVPAKVKNTPRKVLIIGDSLIFVDQARIIEQVEKDGKWDVVLLDAKLGSQVANHPNLAAALANTTYDAVVLSFGYNEISDIRGNFVAPVPFESKIQHWQNAVNTAKTECLGWLTLQHDGWLRVGADYDSVMMQNIRRFNWFIRTTGGKVLPVEWGPVADANLKTEWSRGPNLWIDTDGFHIRRGTWGASAMGIKIRETLNTC